MAVRSLAQSSLRQSPQINSMLAGYQTNQFHHLETVRLGGSASFVDFTNLSRYSDYQHLQLRIVATGSSNEFLVMEFNGDTTAANYRSHRLEGNGSTVASGTLTGYSGVELGYAVTAASNRPFVGVTDILDAFETNKNKVVRTLHGDTQIQLESGLWMNTAAINSLRIKFILTPTLQAGSRFSLYGLKVRA